MRKLVVLLAAFCAPLMAADLVPYGGAYTHQGTIYQQTDPLRLVASSPSFAAGDCLVIVDGATAANCDNLPTWETNGTFAWTMSAAEAAAGTITMILSDVTGAAWLDYSYTFQTYDNASATHTDLGNNQLIDICVEDAAAGSCVSMREILCANLAYQAGEADFDNVSTYTIQDPSGTQNRIVLVYGTHAGDRTSSTLTFTGC